MRKILSQLCAKIKEYHKKGVPLNSVNAKYLAKRVDPALLPSGLLPETYSPQLAQWALQSWEQAVEHAAADLVLPCAGLCGDKYKDTLLQSHCCCSAPALERLVRTWTDSAESETLPLAIKQLADHVRISWEAFNLFDLDRSGTIDQDEVATMLGALGKKVTEQEIQAMVSESCPH